MYGGDAGFVFEKNNKIEKQIFYKHSEKFAGLNLTNEFLKDIW
jgi:hypothetical protein